MPCSIQASLLAFGIASTACGSIENKPPPPQTPEASTMAGHFSCATTNTSGLRTCTDYSFSGSNPPSSLQDKCTMEKGTPGMACDHAHSEGGCLFTMTIDGVETTYVYWYFYDSPSSIMAACAEAKVPYVAP
jgi:hypothetical protein